jgi:competence protein ComEA
MLSSFLVRLAMVALTMAIVCWIGWTIPASRDAETLHAQGPIQAATPVVPLTPPSQHPIPERSRATAPVLLDLNRASEEDLQRLPGIGPVLARRIVETRQAQGPFKAVDQLRRVKGIGKKTFERIRAFVVVESQAVTRPVRKTA